ncbi:MAG: methanogenesis marker 9 domain-containing protein [Promethearchaeota archaeon Loki_b32]|nr:MAG: methanogenesis marker 9 domain-containing protein [Candidatus Lokiarchaeota archaeon Loki_b32]
MVDLDPEKLRDVPGWKGAPIHICMGADYRGLTFCCKPGYSLTHAFICKRDKILTEIGLTPEEFIQIKVEFSNENNWDSEVVCFGSLSYCCMRRNGCPRRDLALVERYPNKSLEEIMKIYFNKKKELSKRILECITSVDGKKKIEPFLDLF